MISVRARAAAPRKKNAAQPLATARASLRFALVTSAVAFALHFVWENVQCPLFFEHGSYDATWLGMVVATAGDVLLTWIVYAWVAIVSRRMRWAFLSWGWLQWTAMSSASLVLAVVVEFRALGSSSWSYTDMAPLIPGTSISLVPIVQLQLLVPLTLRIATRFVRRRSRRNA